MLCLKCTTLGLGIPLSVNINTTVDNFGTLHTPAAFTHLPPSLKSSSSFSEKEQIILPTSAHTHHITSSHIHSPLIYFTQPHQSPPMTSHHTHQATIHTSLSLPPSLSLSLSLPLTHTLHTLTHSHPHTYPPTHPHTHTPHTPHLPQLPFFNRTQAQMKLSAHRLARFTMHCCIYPHPPAKHYT